MDSAQIRQTMLDLRRKVQIARQRALDSKSRSKELVAELRASKEEFDKRARKDNNIAENVDKSETLSNIIQDQQISQELQKLLEDIQAVGFAKCLKDTVSPQTDWVQMVQSTNEKAVLDEFQLVLQNAQLLGSVQCLNDFLSSEVDWVSMTEECDEYISQVLRNLGVLK